MFDHVNWLAVLIATIASFVFNAIWFTPLFGKRWQALVGLGAMAGGPPLPSLLAVNFVLTFVGATAMAVIVTAFPANIAVAAFVAVVVWVASGFQVKINDTLFARRPVGLFYIDGIGHLITLVIIGVIVSLLRT